MRFFLIFFSLIYLSPSAVYSQANLYYCTHNFTTELRINDTHPDVLQLQKFLNSDDRTIVASSGPGSLNSETDYYGAGTEVALAKFQKNNNLTKDRSGVFGFETRTFVNKICKNNKVYLDKNPAITPITSSAPIIRLAKESDMFDNKSLVKVFLTTDVPIVGVNTNSIVIDGGKVTSIRKMAQLRYMLLIFPNDNSSNIFVQVEAESVKSLSGGLTNTDSSNAVTLTRKPVEVLPTTIVPQAETNLPEADEEIDLPEAETLPTTFNLSAGIKSYAELVTYITSISKSYSTTDILKSKNNTEKRKYYINPNYSVFNFVIEKCMLNSGQNYFNNSIFKCNLENPSRPHLTQYFTTTTNRSTIVDPYRTLNSYRKLYSQTNTSFTKTDTEQIREEYTALNKKDNRIPQSSTFNHPATTFIKTFYNHPTYSNISSYEIKSMVKSVAEYLSDNENILVLNNVESLRPVCDAERWGEVKNFNKNVLKSSTLDCKEIFTYTDNALVSLRETSVNYDMRLINGQKNATKQLLLYPKINYAQSCFKETLLEPRYFPEGLFCCKNYPCNETNNLEPITYMIGDKVQLLMFVTTIERTGETGKCLHLPKQNNVEKCDYIRVIDNNIPK